ncbi:ATP-binding protein [Roseomonas sp. JC162]|uniref:ATP-binding protein n=1 Tax=Neoroseomonas marina TaxID=1232220 RepID=A0A848EHI5_9PROT|nr:ATP-binding protein [Neoroseomonas marina]
MTQATGPEEADRLRLSIPASSAGLTAAQPRLRAFLDARGLPGGIADRAELLVEEAVMNVAMHGAEDAATAQVDLLAEAGPDRCILVFEDAGRAFDPTAGELKERPLSLADAEPGGLGLVLMRRMTRELAYERLPEGRNRLRMVLL